jgi:hypothetical protein
VATGYFRILGVAPLLGREFSRDEDVPGGPAVTILSDGMWQRVFGGRSDVIGQSMRLKGQSCQIVGVMPASFENITEADVWTPLRPASTGEGGGTNYEAIARLRPGATWDAVREQLATIGPQAFRRSATTRRRSRCWPSGRCRTSSSPATATRSSCSAPPSRRCW